MSENNILSSFENHLIAEGDELATIRAYSYDLKQLNTFLEQRKQSLISVSAGDLQDFVHKVFNMGLSPVSINRKISSIKAFYRFLLRTKEISANPAEALELLKTRHKLPMVLSIDEISAIVESASDKTPLGLRDRVCLELLYSSGLRISELLSMKLSDLKMSEDLLSIIGKGNKQRLVPFGKKAKRAINEYLNLGRSSILKTRSSPYFILNARGS